MANDNGGIIGIINTPTADTASGVWSLDSQYQAQTTGTWPPIPSIGVNSARFNSGSSDYLNRTPSTGVNRRTFTYSGWIKRVRINDYDIIFEASNGSHSFQMATNPTGDGDCIRIYDYTGTTNLDIKTKEGLQKFLKQRLR